MPDPALHASYCTLTMNSWYKNEKIERKNWPRDEICMQPSKYFSIFNLLYDYSFSLNINSSSTRTHDLRTLSPCRLSQSCLVWQSTIVIVLHALWSTVLAIWHSSILQVKPACSVRLEDRGTAYPLVQKHKTHLRPTGLLLSIAYLLNTKFVQPTLGLLLFYQRY